MHHAPCCPGSSKAPALPSKRIMAAKLRLFGIIAAGFIAFPALAQKPGPTDTLADAADAAPAQPPANVLEAATPDVAAPEDIKVDALSPALAKPEADKKTDATQDLFITALSTVYRTHPQLLAQRETLEATDENVAQAVSNLRPNVSAGYSEGQVTTERDGTNKATIKTANATQPVFVGGAISGIRGAKQRVKAGQAQLTAV